ncbi:RNA-binding motif protein, X-linked 2 [Cylas formicarius]|uniref:RNA-binding motif protein, X-linked 2 n=1 Tax=Cylas formicarius TaxID=197179 RepID=UPI002958DE61|nr:RNA-binding motif protein, X-linked 2 [Cylas formicarius]
MNPLTNMKNVKKLSDQELYSTAKSSWHDQYKDSAWIFVGGLPYDLSEGDIICIFSQYGEVVNINLIRAKDTGKSKGFCFLCYEDQRSTVLAVDNFNGIRILNRTIRVDHVAEYKVPKEGKQTDTETKKLYAEGCAPKAVPVILPKSEKPSEDIRETIADQIEGELKLPPRLPIYANIKEQKISDEEKEVLAEEPKKSKKRKKSKKSKKKRRRSRSSSSSSSEHETRIKVKKENPDLKLDSFDRRNRLESNSDGRAKSPQRSARSRSREKDSEKPKVFRNESNVYIPKRYR